MSAVFSLDIYSIVCLVVFVYFTMACETHYSNALHRGLKVGVEKILLFKLSVQVSQRFCSDCQ